MICPEELVALVSAMAVAIANGLTTDQISILAAVLVQLGDTLDTITVQRERIEECCDSKKANKDETDIIY